jgi:hypothetical protein
MFFPQSTRDFLLHLPATTTHAVFLMENRMMLVDITGLDRKSRGAYWSDMSGSFPNTHKPSTGWCLDEARGTERVPISRPSFPTAGNNINKVSLDSRKPGRCQLLGIGHTV